MQYQYSLYILQQLTSRLLYTKIYFYSPWFILFILLSGLISGLNPCLISMLPIMSSYLFIDQQTPLNSSIFLLGLLSSELVVGSILSIFGYHYYILSIALPLFSSFLSILLALIILQIVFFNVSLSVFNSNEFLISNIYIKNFIFGCVFAINTLPCTLPILLTVLAILLKFNNPITVLFYTLLYVLGYIVPLFSVYILLNQIKSLQLFRIFSLGKWYILLGGSVILSSGVFRCLKIFFYSGVF